MKGMRQHQTSLCDVHDSLINFRSKISRKRCQGRARNTVRQHHHQKSAENY